MLNLPALIQHGNGSLFLLLIIFFQETNMDNKKLIQVLIEMLTKYDSYCTGDILRSPEEFVKNNYCESNLFVSGKYDKCVSVFFQICFLRKLLNAISEDELLPKNISGIVHIYFVLFYITPSNQDAILESFLESFSPRTREKMLKFFAQKEVLDIITQKGCQVYKTPRTLDYLLKEVKERIELISNIEENMVKLEQRKKLESFNYSMENAEEILGSIRTMSSGVSNTYQLSSHIKDHPTDARRSSKSEECLATDPLLQVDDHIVKDIVLYEPPSSEVSRPCKGPVIRKTTAQILRESARISKKMKKSEKLIRDLCTGSHDPFTTQKLIEEAQNQKREMELREIERKHLLGLISLEEARLAKIAVRKKNQLKATEGKRHSFELELKLSEWRQLEEAKLKQSAERLQRSIGQGRAAQLNLMNRKKQAAKEIKQQSLELQKTIEQQRKKELEQKVMLIRQIKDLEHLAKGNREQNDSKSMFSIGPTSSMSINHLKEELRRLRQEVQSQVERRREQIRGEHIRHQKMVQEASNLVERHKTASKLARPSKPSLLLKLTPDLVKLREHLERIRQKSLLVKEHT